MSTDRYRRPGTLFVNCVNFVTSGVGLSRGTHHRMSGPAGRVRYDGPFGRSSTPRIERWWSPERGEQLTSHNWMASAIAKGLITRAVAPR